MRRVRVKLIKRGNTQIKEIIKKKKRRAAVRAFIRRNFLPALQLAGTVAVLLKLYGII